MPSKFVLRSFTENSFYHVFNRGVEKRKIFYDDQDYLMFKYYIFIYISPLKTVLEKYPQLPLRLQSKNLHDQIELIAYCLMSNHFHLLLRQKSRDATSRFLKQLTNAYTEYFNHKYERLGGLMQGRFKAVWIQTEDLLLHVSRYIHLNPLASNLINSPQEYQWSSYPEYLGKEKLLCNQQIIMDRFRSRANYQKFVTDQANYAKELEKIKHLAID